jgi:hypothetical protein
MRESEEIVYVVASCVPSLVRQFCGSVDWENMMVKLGLTAIGIASLTLAVATPAGANDGQTTTAHQSRKHLRAAQAAIGFGDPNLPVENALRWGYSQGYSNYPSGWGGLYGDGRYPGNTISNAGPGNSRP